MPGEAFWPGDAPYAALCQTCWEAYADDQWWKYAAAVDRWQATGWLRRNSVEVVSWLATGIAVTGVVLNNHQSAWCFGFWLVSNSLTACIHLKSRLWGLMVRDLIFLALAVDGWWRWTR